MQNFDKIEQSYKFEISKIKINRDALKALQNETAQCLFSYIVTNCTSDQKKYIRQIFNKRIKQEKLEEKKFSKQFEDKLCFELIKDKNCMQKVLKSLQDCTNLVDKNYEDIEKSLLMTNLEPENIFDLYFHIRRQINVCNSAEKVAYFALYKNLDYKEEYIRRQNTAMEK